MSNAKSHYYFIVVVIIIIIIIIIHVDFCHLTIWPLDSSQYVEDEETLTSHSVNLCLGPGCSKLRLALIHK